MSIVRTDARHPIVKHPGPDGSDTHSTGTPQDEHGVWSEGQGEAPAGSRGVAEGTSAGYIHGASPVHVTRGTGAMGDKFLTDEDGNEILNSYEDIDDARFFVHSDGQKVSAIQERHYGTVHQRIDDTLAAYGLDKNVLAPNMRLLLESAAARYAADPSIQNLDKFYEQWHVSLSTLAVETNIDFSNVIAGAAAISPGLKAPANLQFAHDLARYISANDGRGVVLAQGAAVDPYLGFLDEQAEKILNPTFGDNHKAVIEGKKKVGDPAPKPKVGGARWLEAQQIKADIQMLRGADTITVSDLSGTSAAYALHRYRAENGSPEGGLLGEVATHPEYQVVPGGGFQMKSFDNYAKAVNAMRGYDHIAQIENGEIVGRTEGIAFSPNDALGDVKTRSFHNNILDPNDILGRRDVTVDFHTINLGFFVYGADSETSLNGTPALAGVGFGVRPLVADFVRQMSSEYATTFEGGHVPSRIQEILWAEWRRGTDAAAKAGYEDSWMDYSGNVTPIDSVAGKYNP